MHNRSHRGSWAGDCFLAAYTLALAALFAAAFANVFPWQGTLAILMLPTLMLSRHARYRAAAIAAAAALLTGAWVIIPPRWSLHVHRDGLLAIVTFASAALLSIALPAHFAHRRAVHRGTGAEVSC